MTAAALPGSEHDEKDGDDYGGGDYDDEGSCHRARSLGSTPGPV